MPHYDGASSSGVGKGYIEKPAIVRKGSGKPAALALRAACSGLKIKDGKQTVLVPGTTGITHSTEDHQGQDKHLFFYGPYCCPPHPFPRAPKLNG